MAKKNPEKLKKIRNGLSEELKDKTSFTLADFVKVWNVKAMLELETDETKIKRVTSESFEADSLEDKLKTLSELDGIGPPMASAILSIKYPERYSIIDKNCLTRLNREGTIGTTIPSLKKSPDSYVFSFW
jgi:endonuclease III